MVRKGKENGDFLKWEVLKRDWPLWVLWGVLLAGAVILYPYLPEQIPRHWNFRGEVDAYWGRFYGAFIPLLVILACYFLLLFMPYLDPKRENYQRFSGAYTLMRWILVLFLAGIYILSILAALGYNFAISLGVKLGVAVLFILIGNFMGQFRHNYFVGIKTPWTLADEDVWQKTHRLGARVWVIGGIVCFIASFINSSWGAALFLAAVIAMVLVPVIYSYVFFRQSKN